MFRDRKIAHYEMEIARLRDELDKAKSDDQEMIQKLHEAEEALRAEKQKAGMKPKTGTLPQPTREYGAQRPWWPRFKFRWPSFNTMIVVGIFFGIGLVGLNVYYYATDIQEGVVTSKAYHPPVTTCTTNDGQTSCTTMPESWTVDIAYRGRTATWSVTEDEYHRRRRGQWFCYTDLFHPRENCHGPED